MNFDDLKQLFGLTFRDPDGAAVMLIRSGLPMPVRWMALIVAVSVSAILSWLSAQLFVVPEAEAQSIMTISSQPLVMAGLQLGAIVLASLLMTGVGRLFGGEGRFEDALLLTVWIEIVLLVVQLVQVALSLLSPTIAGFLGLAAIVLFLWLTVRFTKVLHGFRSPLKVFLGLVGTAFVAGFALSFLAAAFGLMPDMAR
ncbi:YIP1 family protein [Paracoccus sp. (in: a-proteobacteria)]|jgi:hypothetical protein|uniref:YIP1 family protein n=1 Tax=Paracoccus sp. TaxID=267 RepID=UPI00233AFAFE|nr:YIP1 family protein [Paracoccus sp. (in: a-proteobacteria)]MDB2551972.1 YIP1 family protein [Paracoccus sp. (in: a-proteobacteria)]|tara:strand:- start:1628 stop:2221 length:594 start_codon:yes stop_codon:yes gene_type:complete